jgi:hypothetical protein
MIQGRLNNRFLRERGMASNPKMEYQAFLCIFQQNSAMATLGLKEMGKFLWELGKLFSKFIEKMQKKSGIMKSGLDAMPLFLLDDLLRIEPGLHTVWHVVVLPHGEGLIFIHWVDCMTMASFFSPSIMFLTFFSQLIRQLFVMFSLSTGKLRKKTCFGPIRSLLKAGVCCGPCNPSKWEADI